MERGYWFDDSTGLIPALFHAIHLGEKVDYPPLFVDL